MITVKQLLSSVYLIKWNCCHRQRGAGNARRGSVGRTGESIRAPGCGASGEFPHMLRVRSVRDGTPGAAHAHIQQHRHAHTRHWQLQFLDAVRRAAEDEWVNMFTVIPSVFISSFLSSFLSPSVAFLPNFSRFVYSFIYVCVLHCLFVSSLMLLIPYFPVSVRTHHGTSVWRQWKTDALIKFIFRTHKALLFADFVFWITMY